MPWLAGLLALLCAGPVVTTGDATASPRESTPEGTSAATGNTDVPAGQLHDLVTSGLTSGDSGAFWREAEALAAAGEYPFVEPTEESSPAPDDYVRLTFLHRQRTETAPHNVFLFANINHVLPEELLFERIGETDVWFKMVEVPPGARFEYRIHENDPLTGLFAGAKYGTRFHLLAGDPDPLNPRKRVFEDGLGDGEDFVQTWVELPGAPRQPWIEDRGNPRCTVIEEERDSELLGYPRRIVTVLPPAYDPEGEYPLLVLFDIDSYLVAGSLQLTLENLFAAGEIPPLVVLGINAGVEDGQSRRNDELTCSPVFERVLRDEILSWFESAYAVSDDPDRRVIAGSSFGGLFATYFAFRNPDVVSRVLSQSGSFHWGRAEDPVPFEWLVREFAFGETRPITLWLEVGLLEGEYTWTNPHFPHQVVSHRHFQTILDMKGYDVKYREYVGGHEMLSWQGGIADGLMRHFGSAGG
jgi:enterochelin esterase family protein